MTESLGPQTPEEKESLRKGEIFVHSCQAVVGLADLPMSLMAFAMAFAPVGSWAFDFSSGAFAYLVFSQGKTLPILWAILMALPFILGMFMGRRGRRRTILWYALFFLPLALSFGIKSIWFPEPEWRQAAVAAVDLPLSALVLGLPVWWLYGVIKERRSAAT